MASTTRSTENNNSSFISGGGKMGERIRQLNWSGTSVGPMHTWPQSLRTTLSILLNSKFPMFLYWGPDYTCFYNDAFCPSLGYERDHAALLGKPAHEFWAESWHNVEPGVARVKAGGESTWSEDQLIPIYRNGKLEDVYWTYSFSPVYDETGVPGGVLVTSIETTQKVQSLARLEESTDALTFAIEATELATFDVNPVTNKLKGNARLKEWFGLSAHEEVDIHNALDVIIAEDKPRVLAAIEHAYTLSSGGLYDIEYTIISPASGQERHVRAKGRVWFNNNKAAYRFNGTLQDITTIVSARRKHLESETRFRNLIEQVPVAIALTRGSDHVFVDINPSMLRIINRKNKSDVIGLEITEALPEIKNQEVMQLYHQVLKTGVPFTGNEVPVQVNNNGKPEQGYYNLSYTPLLENGKVTGIIHAAIDVTEQVLTRKKLEESERQIRTMIDAAPFPIAVYVGREMKVQIANQVVFDTWGKGNDVIGSKLSDILPELESQQIFALLDQVFTTGIPFSAKDQRVDLVVDNQLQSYYFNNNFTPLFDDAGKVYAIMNTAANITELIKTQQKVEEYTHELQESERRFRNFVKASNDTLYRMSPDWKQMLTLEGKDFVSITDKPTKTWLDDFILPEDQALGLHTINEAIRTKTIFKLEHRVVKADGSVGWTYSKAIPVLNNAGDILEWFGAAADITEQKLAKEALEESEQRFRIMADASPAMIWALNPDSSLKYANKFMLEFLGISFEKFVADNWVPYLPQEDLERTNHTIGNAIAERKPFRNEHRFLRHDGTYRWLLAQGAPSYYPNGEIYGYVGSSIDITELKEAELKLQLIAGELAAANEDLRTSHEQVLESNDTLSSTVKQLSHINADMDNFIYTASHDLRAPISNIEGLMHAILDELPEASTQEPVMKRIFELVTASIERFKQTIDDMTEITKIQREEAGDQDNRIDLSHVIEDTQLDLSPQIEEANATFDIQIATCKPISFSSKNVRSVIYNLLSNAIKYRSPERPLRIQIRCYQQQKYQVLSVQDNGLGMDLTDDTKVFGMFKRLHDHVEGSGVGLYIVKKILENAGGKIEVESKVGEGTIFRVFFLRSS